MKLVQAKEWAKAYVYTDNFANAYDLESMLIDAYTAGWREGWEDGELCGYNNGRDHDEVSLEIVRNAGIQEGIERMQKAYQIRPRGKSMLAYLPEGYVLVPKEPTQKMLDAGWLKSTKETHLKISNIYQAMIQASQEEA